MRGGNAAGDVLFVETNQDQGARRWSCRLHGGDEAREMTIKEFLPRHEELPALGRSTSSPSILTLYATLTLSHINKNQEGFAGGEREVPHTAQHVPSSQAPSR